MDQIGSAPVYHPLTGTPSVVSAGPLRLDPVLETHIHRLWARACLENQALFDGPILSVLDVSPERITVQEANYRHLLAARDPSLGGEIGILPLAVSGLLRCADGFVLGRRGGGVTQDAGLWELAPSGGAVGRDLVRQILEELEEEIGLAEPQAAVLPASAILMAADVVDVVFPLQCALTAAQIEDAHRRFGSREYSELLVTADPKSLLEQARHLSPATRVLLVNQIE